MRSESRVLSRSRILERRTFDSVSSRPSRLKRLTLLDTLQRCREPRTVLETGSQCPRRRYCHALQRTLPYRARQKCLTSPPLPSLLAGSGSGYLCGLFHSLVQPGGTVLGIDHLPELVTLARHNLARDPSAAAALCPDETSPVSEGNQEGGRTMQVITADGRNGAPKGFVPQGGWQVRLRWQQANSSTTHRIFLPVRNRRQFMSELLLPAFLKLSSIRYASSTKRCYCSPLTFDDESARPPFTQLASPGRMFIPVGDFSQNIWQVDKDADGQVTKHRLFGVSYVP